MERLRLQIDVSRDTCPYCKDEVRPNGDNVACKACMAWHHTECWSSFDACSACRATVALRPSEKACGHPVRTCQHFACNNEATSELYARRGVNFCHTHALNQLRTSASILKGLTIVFGVGVLLFGVMGLIETEMFFGVAACIPMTLLFWILKVVQDQSVEQEQRAGWRR